MIRRFLTRILMVVLIAVCGYNVWQIHHLQEDMVRLQSATQTAHRPAMQQAAPSENASSRSWLGQADLHAGRARQAIGRADFDTARHEIERGVDDVHRAVQEPEAKTQATLGQARRTLTALQSQADSLWRKLHATRPAMLR